MSAYHIEHNMQRLVKKIDLPEIDTGARRLFLSPAEITELSGNGIDFGSHTSNHVILPVENRDAINNELTHSRQALEDIVGRSMTMLSYPNGNTSHETIQCAQESGYRIGCNIRRGSVGRSEDSMQLARIDADWDELVGSDENLDDYLLQWEAR